MSFARVLRRVDALDDHLDVVRVGFDGVDQGAPGLRSVLRRGRSVEGEEHGHRVAPRAQGRDEVRGEGTRGSVERERGPREEDRDGRVGRERVAVIGRDRARSQLRGDVQQNHRRDRELREEGFAPHRRRGDVREAAPRARAEEGLPVERGRVGGVNGGARGGVERALARQTPTVVHGGGRAAGRAAAAIAARAGVQAPGRHREWTRRASRRREEGRPEAFDRSTISHR